METGPAGRRRERHHAVRLQVEAELRGAISALLVARRLGAFSARFPSHISLPDAGESRNDFASATRTSFCSKLRASRSSSGLDLTRFGGQFVVSLSDSLPSSNV